MAAGALTQAQADARAAEAAANLDAKIDGVDDHHGPRDIDDDDDDDASTGSNAE